VLLHFDGETVVASIETLAGDFLDTLAPAGPLPLQGTPGWLRIEGVLRIMSRTFRTASLGSLRPGDVLLAWTSGAGYVPGAPLEHAAVLWGAPRGIRCRAAARVDGSKIIIESTPTLMTDDQPSAAQGGTLHALEIPVHVELATVDISLGDLMALQPGSIMSIDVPVADAEVQFVAYGQCVGKGRLVVVGDQLGVQVSTFAHSHG
jgi:type III secretion protein Q